jgi:hypothetical protein
MLPKKTDIQSLGKKWKGVQPHEYSSTVKSHIAEQSRPAESPFWTGTNESPEVDQPDHAPQITYENRESSETSVANAPDFPHYIRGNSRIRHSVSSTF